MWRYEGESDDVAGLFIARTQFILANGSHHVGFCYSGRRLAAHRGPVYFCFDAPPSQETLDAQWLRLGVGHEQIFPRPNWPRRELETKVPNAGS